MILYLLKSASCLFILLLVHRLLLQREAIYQFNRFYLLAAVIGSFLIPMVEIEAPAEAKIAAQQSIEESDFSADYQELPFQEIEGIPVFQAVEAEQELDWSIILWIGYGLITLVLFIRFVRNISLLMDKINKNVHVTYRGETLVLLKSESLPFTFLSYIFVSKGYFENNQLTDAIFAHEQAHVHGKHSWDNLMIEALLVPLWFHPGLYLARQAIKLNHEFIADEAALQVTPLDQYKTFLLAMMSPRQSPGLASSLNFSLTKKRFEMMKRSTANSTKWIKILFVLPVFAVLVYFLSERVTAQADQSQNSESSEMQPNQENNEIAILLQADDKLEVDGQIMAIEELAELIKSKNPENTLVRFSAAPEVEMGFLADVQKVLRENDLRKVVYEDQSHQKQDVIQQDEMEVYYRNAYILVEDENMEYTHKSFSQLTEKEKKGLLPPLAPSKKKQLDPDLYQSWKDNHTYAIWIDGVVTPNEKLNDYKSVDFVGFFQSGVKANARSKRFPQPFQVHLYTDPYFDLHFGPNSEMRQSRTNQDTITITTRMVTWHKDIQKYPDPTTAFLQKNARYEKLRTSGTLYSQKSEQEKSKLETLYNELIKEYSNFSDQKKKSLTEPIFPNSDIGRNGGPSSSAPEKISARTVRNTGDQELVYMLAHRTEWQSKALKEYLQHYGDFQTKANESRFGTQKTKSEIQQLLAEYQEFTRLYAALSFSERRLVKRPTFPYARLEKDGILTFKHFHLLTPEERNALGC